MTDVLSKNQPSKGHLGQRSKKPRRAGRWVRPAIAYVVAVFGVSLIILGISASIQATYAFSNTARTIQGTVEISDETTDFCSYTISPSGCQSTTTCSTTVYFAPPEYNIRLNTTDTQCNALAEGTKVEVFYDPYNPGRAKTAREVSTNITGGIGLTIIWPIVALYLLFVLVRSIERNSFFYKPPRQ